MTDATLRIGRVVEVTGSRVRAELLSNVEELYRSYRSRRYTVGQIGSLVRIEVGDALVFCSVTALRMQEDEANSKAGDAVRDVKWLDLDLLGEGTRTGLGSTDFEFRRGVSTYPLPGQFVYIATAAELSRIYSIPDEPSIPVGTITQTANLPLHLRIDELLGKHFAVLGTTGSGKSCAVAGLVHSIAGGYQHGHIIVLDLHNEYKTCFGELGVSFDPTTLCLPHWLLTLEETFDLFVGKTEFVATSQMNILKDALIAARQAFKEYPPDFEVTPDTPIPYTLKALMGHIEKNKPEQASKQESHLKILNKIKVLQSDSRLRFLVTEDGDVSDNLTDIVSTILRAPTAGKPISIVDLSGVPSDVLDVVVSVLSRLIFSFAVWSPADQRMPVLIICEEAHRYVPRGGGAAFSAAREGLERIAKEGRKYGVGLGLISQRPAELSETVLSQCNSIIALRIANEADQAFVKRAFPDSTRNMVDALSSLRTQEALIVGEAVAVPTRFRFTNLPLHRRPHSNNPVFSECWSKDQYGLNFVNAVIESWRRQRRTKERLTLAGLDNTIRASALTPTFA